MSSAIDATASIANGGTLIGAIATGDLDDSLVNAAGARWFALGTSDFGAGDDRIVNHGAIFMDDATIRLGTNVEGDGFEHGFVAVVDFAP